MQGSEAVNRLLAGRTRSKIPPNDKDISRTGFFGEILPALQITQGIFPHRMDIRDMEVSVVEYLVGIDVFDKMPLIIGKDPNSS